MSDVVLTEPTAYVYNGHRIPKAKCIDEYSHAIIYRSGITPPKYTVYCANSPITIELNDSGDSYLLVREAPNVVCYYEKGDKDWKYGTPYISQTRTYLVSSWTPVWSSHQITYPDGSIYMSASKAPCALYEGNTEINDFEVDLYSWTVGLIFGLVDGLDIIDNSAYENEVNIDG